MAPGAVFAKSPLAEDEKNKKILEKIENVSVGFTLAEDFTMATAIVTKTADSAKEISEELKNGIETLKGLWARVWPTEGACSAGRRRWIDQSRDGERYGYPEKRSKS